MTKAAAITLVGIQLQCRHCAIDAGSAGELIARTPSSVRSVHDRFKSTLGTSLIRVRTGLSPFHARLRLPRAFDKLAAFA